MPNLTKSILINIGFLLIGVIITYNALVSQIEYRISFYGYKVISEHIVPIIKLRKCYTFDLGFNINDPGKELELNMDGLKPGQVIRFTDEIWRKKTK